MLCCRLYSIFPTRCPLLVIKIFHSIFHFPTQLTFYRRHSHSTISLLFLCFIIYFIFHFALSSGAFLPPPLPAINFILFHLSFMYFYSEYHILFSYFRFAIFLLPPQPHGFSFFCHLMHVSAGPLYHRLICALHKFFPPFHFISYLPFAIFIFILSFYLCISCILLQSFITSC